MQFYVDYARVAARRARQHSDTRCTTTAGTAPLLPRPAGAAWSSSVENARYDERVRYGEPGRCGCVRLSASGFLRPDRQAAPVLP